MDGKDDPAVIVWAWLLSRRFELLVQVNLQQLEEDAHTHTHTHTHSWCVPAVTVDERCGHFPHHLSHSTEGTEHAKLIPHAPRQPWCLLGQIT